MQDDVQFTPYDHTRFPAHLPFGRCGYLFTVPGDFPEDTPAHTKVTDCEMAVYRALGEWEVRDVNGIRRVWGTGPSRRKAVGLAFQEIARKRRMEAADIAAKRKAAGLQEAPPVYVETTSSVTFVCAPTAIAVLRWIGPVHENPVRYHVRDIDGGDPYEIRADSTVTLRTTKVGVLHNQCGCTPGDAARFEHETAALVYAREALTVCHPCPKNPEAGDEVFTVDGSDYGPYPARRVPDTWGPYEAISVSLATAERIAHDLNTLNTGCGLTAEWNGAHLAFTWDRRYRDDEGTQTVTPDTEGRYLIGGLWPWMRWADRD
ncbi:hypothetical protein PV387_03540 [Streptomyces sp. ME02-6987-2C]|uniref:hypothetical protein n=1 Tax=unclassified Streptomyces TaxID=2593676 RepID=UPI0029A38A78|nr:MULTISPECIES: hypothetical protein [unclassified Streptomyces]MDX3345914.1 hypothetical protein [Streptomyces sp. ME02-6979A]MDX3365108.1 hypothetical protein [Streptomyces sp. ME02-6987-2C]MDX3404836.1 hypothetical protein [Streptomyces sp. ME02-6977A]MDX3421680.1 hypothetical protein [Streptomyces sp. ME02-6985-2c]